jgi:hypothetical protein
VQQRTLSQVLSETSCLQCNILLRLLIILFLEQLGGLDEGPIIVQDVATVNHAVTVPEFIAVGRDIERRVLVKAVKLFSEDRIFLVGDKTVVF